MDSEATQSADVFRLVTWALKNQKRLLTGAGVVGVVGFGAWLYSWNASHHQAVASEALSELRPTVGQAENRAVPADAFAKVSDTYPGTAAAGRAVLLAAGALFDSGKYAEAQAQFERFLRDYGDSPWRTEAQIGVASSLEAAGKVDLALTKYKEILDRRPTDATSPQVKSALARLYLAQIKPDQALRLYEDLAKAHNNDSWSSEAEMQARELLLKHPELKPPAPAPAPVPAPTPVPMTPTPAAAAKPTAITVTPGAAPAATAAPAPAKAPVAPAAAPKP